MPAIKIISKNSIDLSCKPRLGMEFDSEETAYEFYNKYALKDTHAKNKQTGEITSRVFVCCKQGYQSKSKTGLPKVKYRAETRTWCNAG